MSARIGVYVCYCGSNIGSKVDVVKVREAAERLPNVVLAKEYTFMCSEPGQKMIQDDIREHDLNRIVVAACSPLMHEKTFRAVVRSAGLNPYLLQVANIREQCSWVVEDRELATEKAIALVGGAVARACFLKPLKESGVPLTRSVLVVGGGIAGIQAALQCADAGLKVYLVERKQSIGGHMAMLDKTFPTLDCSACILTPKMVDAGKHPNIELMTYSEVEHVGGFVGNYKVRIKRKATHVDSEKCNGCGLCQQKCPLKVENEFEQGKGQRRGIYTMFPQAVPNKPVIDEDRCNYFQRGICRVCEKLCPKKAIDFDQVERVEEVTVGGIIVATGHEMFNAEALANYGYGRLPDVYTSLEFERMVCSSGFSEGRVRTSDGEKPKAVGIVHCIGSRDKRHLPYCSQVCCMYSLKFAHLVREHTDAEVYNFYIDMRCVGKGYEQFYDRVQNEGVKFIRGKVGRVTDSAEDPSEEGKMIVEVEDTLAGVVRRIPLDMVILANGLRPNSDARDVARILNISTDREGFYMEQHPKLNPVGTANPCIFMAGTCVGPKDIPQSVAQASAAAAGVVSLLSQDRIILEAITAEIDADICTGCRTCVEGCPYDALKFDEELNRACLDEGLCRGCGTCVASCPSNAIEGGHFTDNQLMAELEGILRARGGLQEGAVASSAHGSLTELES